MSLEDFQNFCLKALTAANAKQPNSSVEELAKHNLQKICTLFSSTFSEGESLLPEERKALAQLVEYNLQKI